MSGRRGKKRDKQADMTNDVEDFALQPETLAAAETAETPSEALPASDEPLNQTVEAADGGASAEEKAEVDNSEANKETEPAEPEEAKTTAGMLLKQAREAMGLTVDSAAAALKLAPRQIAALESDTYETLPARTFVRGFVRNYARLLNVDPDVVLALLPPETQAEVSPAAVSVKQPTSAMPVLPLDGDFPRTQRKVWRWLIALIVLALFFVVLLFKPQIEGWLEKFQAPADADAAQEELVIAPSVNGDAALQTLPQPSVILLGEASTAAPQTGTPIETQNPLSTSSEANSTLPVLETPIVVSADENAQQSPGDAELILVFDADSWVEVRDAEGKALYMELARGGTERTIHGKPPFSLVLGNGRAIRLTFQGQPVDTKNYHTDGVARLTLE